MITYNKFWLLLNRRGYSPRDIIHLAGISESIYRKMSRNEAVRMDVLERMCAALRVDVGDVCSFIRSSLFSSPHDSWEVYVNYGKMYGVSYVDADNAVAHRNAMKSEIEAEYERNGLDPSGTFIDAFAKRYQLDILGALF